ncbi:MAG: hypothetical protein RL094_735 [Candidatus Parcubacteria bacterium]|jgi:predicted alpha/beta hydrolase family esterase
MKKVYIVHGYGGHPDSNWFPWLKMQLEKHTIDVVVPAMPHTDTPQKAEWVSYMQSIVKDPNEDTYFVGHSLGCSTILHYIETLPDDIKVGGAVLVAGFISPIHFSELDEFTQIPLDKEKIKKSVKKLVAISSDNDQHVPYAQAEEMRDYLGAELITIAQGRHLNTAAGYTEFPLLFEEIIKMMELDIADMI